MTLEEIMRDIHAMREDLLTFERKYGVPSEVFYEAYQQGEEPADSTWVLDWSQWASSFELLQERLAMYQDVVAQLVANKTVSGFPQLVDRTSRHCAQYEFHTAQSPCAY